MLTFSISCLKVVNTSLLFESVFWNSANFSVYNDNYEGKEKVQHIKKIAMECNINYVSNKTECFFKEQMSQR